MAEKQIKKEFMPVVALLKQIADKHPEIDYITISRHADDKFTATSINCESGPNIKDSDIPQHCEELEEWE